MASDTLVHNALAEAETTHNNITNPLEVNDPGM